MKTSTFLNTIGQKIITYTTKKYYQPMGRTALLKRLVAIDYAGRNTGSIELASQYRRALDHLVDTDWLTSTKVDRTNMISIPEGTPKAYDCQQTPEQAAQDLQEEQEEVRMAVRKEAHHKRMRKACRKGCKLTSYIRIRTTSHTTPKGNNAMTQSKIAMKTEYPKPIIWDKAVPTMAITKELTTGTDRSDLHIRDTGKAWRSKAVKAQLEHDMELIEARVAGYLSGKAAAQEVVRKARVITRRQPHTQAAGTTPHHQG